MLASLLDNLRSTSPKFATSGSAATIGEKLSSDSGNRSGYTSCEEDFSSTSSAAGHADSAHGGGKMGKKFPFTSSAATANGGHLPTTHTANSTSAFSGAQEHKKNSGDGASSNSNSPMGSFKAAASGKKGEKVLDILSWDLSLIKAELDALRGLQADCRGAFAQVSLERLWDFEVKVINFFLLFTICNNL